MKLACVAPDADWGGGDDEVFFIDLLKGAGLPVDRMSFEREVPGDCQFVLLSGRNAISPFVNADPGLVLARPFVIREPEQQVGFPLLHWSSYRRNPPFRAHLAPAAKFLKYVASMFSRGEFWFEEAPLACVACNGVEDGVALDTHWFPWCPTHAVE